MYEEFYGLKEKPFNMTPDPEYLFLTEKHREALAHLTYGIEQRRGFIVITGDIGTGKTTLCRTLLTRFGENTRIALILNPLLSETELLKTILNEFYVPIKGESKKELLDLLDQFLIRQHSQGRNVVLVIDEAQNLPEETLEQIRIISNLETEKIKLIQIVLLGQPQLSDKLAQPSLEQLEQRVSVRYHLGPLSEEETCEYVDHRIRVAGGELTIFFEDRALQLIHEYTQGVPRKINVLCDRALLVGYVQDTGDITEQIIKKARKELRALREKKTRAHTEDDDVGARPFAGMSLSTRILLITFAVVAIVSLGTNLWLAGSMKSLFTEQAPTNVTPSVDKNDPGSVSFADNGLEHEPAAIVERAPQEKPQQDSEPIVETTVESREVISEPSETELDVPGKIPENAPEAAVGPASATPALNTPTNVPPTITPTEAPPTSTPVPQVTPPLQPIPQLQTPHAVTSGLPPGGIEQLPDWTMEKLSQIWGIEEGAQGFTRAALRERGFSEVALVLDASRLRAINLPGVLSFDRNSPPVVLARIDAENGLVADADGNEKEVILASLLDDWTGHTTYLVPSYWCLDNNFRRGRDSNMTLFFLQHDLQRMGYFDYAPNGNFGPRTEKAIKEFQKSRGLQPDGIIGPETFFALRMTTGGTSIPKLTDMASEKISSGTEA